MTSFLYCDYCGLPIDEVDDQHVTISAVGREASDTRFDDFVNEMLGHYHATREHPCYEEMWQRMLLIHEHAQSLEHIPTASGQKIAQLRRKLKPAG